MFVAESKAEHKHTLYSTLIQRHVDPLLGDDREISNNTTAITK
jgi:hypothetical protein